MQHKYIYCLFYTIIYQSHKKNPTVSIRHHEEVRLESLITHNEQSTRYTKTNITTITITGYIILALHTKTIVHTYILHIIYHIPLLLISRSDSSVMEDIRKLSNGALLEARTPPKLVNLFLISHRSKIICCVQVRVTLSQ